MTSASPTRGGMSTTEESLSLSPGRGRSTSSSQPMNCRAPGCSCPMYTALAVGTDTTLALESWLDKSSADSSDSSVIQRARNMKEITSGSGMCSCSHSRASHTRPVIGKTLSSKNLFNTLSLSSSTRDESTTAHDLSGLDVMGSSFLLSAMVEVEEEIDKADHDEAVAVLDAWKEINKDNNDMRSPSSTSTKYSSPKPSTMPVESPKEIESNSRSNQDDENKLVVLRNELGAVKAELRLTSDVLNDLKQSENTLREKLNISEDLAANLRKQIESKACSLAETESELVECKKLLSNLDANRDIIASENQQTIARLEAENEELLRTNVNLQESISDQKLKSSPDSGDMQDALTVQMAMYESMREDMLRLSTEKDVIVLRNKKLHEENVAVSSAAAKSMAANAQMVRNLTIEKNSLHDELADAKLQLSLLTEQLERASTSSQVEDLMNQLAQAQQATSSTRSELMVARFELDEAVAAIQRKAAEIRVLEADGFKKDQDILALRNASLRVTKEVILDEDQTSTPQQRRSSVESSKSRSKSPAEQVTTSSGATAALRQSIIRISDRAKRNVINVMQSVGRQIASKMLHSSFTHWQKMTKSNIYRSLLMYLKLQNVINLENQSSLLSIFLFWRREAMTSVSLDVSTLVVKSIKDILYTRISYIKSVVLNMSREYISSGFLKWRQFVQDIVADELRIQSLWRGTVLRATKAILLILLVRIWVKRTPEFAFNVWKQVLFNAHLMKKDKEILDTTEELRIERKWYDETAIRLSQVQQMVRVLRAKCIFVTFERWNHHSLHCGFQALKHYAHSNRGVNQSEQLEVLMSDMKELTFYVDGVEAERDASQCEQRRLRLRNAELAVWAWARDGLRYGWRCWIEQHTKMGEYHHCKAIHAHMTLRRAIELWSESSQRRTFNLWRYSSSKLKLEKELENRGASYDRRLNVIIAEMKKLENQKSQLSHMRSLIVLRHEFRLSQMRALHAWRYGVVHERSAKILSDVREDSVAALKKCQEESDFIIQTHSEMLGQSLRKTSEAIDREEHALLALDRSEKEVQRLEVIIINTETQFRSIIEDMKLSEQKSTKRIRNLQEDWFAVTAGAWARHMLERGMASFKKYCHRRIIIKKILVMAYSIARPSMLRQGFNAFEMSLMTSRINASVSNARLIHEDWITTCNDRVKNAVEHTRVLGMQALARHRFLSTLQLYRRISAKMSLQYWREHYFQSKADQFRETWVQQLHLLATTTKQTQLNMVIFTAEVDRKMKLLQSRYSGNTTCVRRVIICNSISLGLLHASLRLRNGWSIWKLFINRDIKKKLRKTLFRLAHYQYSCADMKYKKRMDTALWSSYSRWKDAVAEIRLKALYCHICASFISYAKQSWLDLSRSAKLSAFRAWKVSVYVVLSDGRFAESQCRLISSKVANIIRAWSVKCLGRALRFWANTVKSRKAIVLEGIRRHKNQVITVLGLHMSRFCTSYTSTAFFRWKEFVWENAHLRRKNLDDQSSKQLQFQIATLKEVSLAAVKSTKKSKQQSILQAHSKASRKISLFHAFFKWLRFTHASQADFILADRRETEHCLGKLLKVTRTHPQIIVLFSVLSLWRKNLLLRCYYHWKQHTIQKVNYVTTKAVIRVMDRRSLAAEVKSLTQMDVVKVDNECQTGSESSLIIPEFKDDFFAGQSYWKRLEFEKSKISKMMETGLEKISNPTTFSFSTPQKKYPDTMANILSSLLLS